MTSMPLLLSHTTQKTSPYQTNPPQPQRKAAFQAHPEGPHRELASKPEVLAEPCITEPSCSEQNPEKNSKPLPADRLLLNNKL